MVLPVEFSPPTTYSTQPEMRTLIEELVRKHHAENLLGKDGKIYDKAVVMQVSLIVYVSVCINQKD
jgi:hypothetical protein